MSLVIGIDYSYKCPSVCALDNSAEWFVNYKKDGHPYPKLPTVDFIQSSADEGIPRFIELANWVLNIVKTKMPSCIVLEDYAFGANGRLTQLSENAGTLKVKLYEQFPMIPLHIVAPSTIKKFATGKGTATKDDMWKSFIETFPHAESWAKLCHPKATKIGSPMGDIADSYFLAKYGVNHYAI